MIFTSPSSADGNLDAIGGEQPQIRRGKKPSIRPPVATQLNMGGKITARAIAYTAVQVSHLLPLSSWLTPFPKLHFALNDATQWVDNYNGFNYEEFYEFIIDFFEDDQTPEGKAAANELFDWWNRYASNSGLISFTTDTTPDVCFHSLLLHVRPHPYPQDDHHLRSCVNSAAPRTIDTTGFVPPRRSATDV